MAPERPGAPTKLKRSPSPPAPAPGACGWVGPPSYKVNQRYIWKFVPNFTDPFYIHVMALSWSQYFIFIMSTRNEKVS